MRQFLREYTLFRDALKTWRSHLAFRYHLSEPDFVRAVARHHDALDQYLLAHRPHFVSGPETAPVSGPIPQKREGPSILG